MDYKNKYDAALKRCRKLYNEAKANEYISDIEDYEFIFPELAESDEKIRKTLIRFFKDQYSNETEMYDGSVTVGKAITWLENLSEQASAIRWYDVSLIPQEMEELLVEWNSEDATWHEIAFYHPDTKTFWNGTRQVENVTRWCYIIDLIGKQANEPAWCHHKVDLSDCSEEYRKGYYDGWNNCNMQHVQCDADKNDVIKCLINGMRFYYENNKNATWGTVKWSMPVKHIIEVLEKQVKQSNNEEAEKEKNDYVSGQFLYCKGSFNEFKEGESYWLEYIGNDNYIGRSDNILNQNFHITPRQLYTWLDWKHDYKHIENINDENNAPREYGKYNDEQMKSEAISIIQSYMNICDEAHDPYYTGEKVIDWLESLGGQKPTNDTNEEIVNVVKDISILNNLAEPKFKVGDWVTNSIETVQITGYDIDYGYQVDYKGNLQHRDTDIIEKEYHLWTIEDAKDGDVLCYKDEVLLYKHDIKDWKETSFGGIVYYCCYDGKRFITDSFYSLTEQDKIDIHPATKEQRDTLFKEMRKSGYRWDANKKELEKIVIDEGKNEMDDCFTKMMNGEKVSPTWSEDDDENLNRVIGVIERREMTSIVEQYKDILHTYIYWLKSLKQRFGGK